MIKKKITPKVKAEEVVDDSFEKIGGIAISKVRKAIVQGKEMNEIFLIDGSYLILSDMELEAKKDK